MSAPTCGARTWVSPDDLVTCDRTDRHECHDGPSRRGRRDWYSATCVCLVDGMRRELKPDEARALIASLQRQLDALDPDAAIAEAERRMVEAHRHVVDMVAAVDACGGRGGRVSVGDRARAARRAAYDAWLALVEARGTKGGAT